MVVLKIWEDKKYLYVQGTKKDKDRLLNILREEEVAWEKD